MSEAQSTPAIVARYYEFLKWLKQHVNDFPRNERYTFGQRIENKSIDILENLIEACYQRNKLEILRQTNRDLEVLRYFLRLCKDFKLINIRQYQYASTQLFEIGQQLGGWIKQQQTSGKRP
jgi:four helix bundle protein